MSLLQHPEKIIKYFLQFSLLQCEQHSTRSVPFNMYFSGETIQSVLQSNGFSCQFCDMVLNSLEQLEHHRIGKIIKMILLHMYVNKLVQQQVIYFLCVFQFTPPIGLTALIKLTCSLIWSDITLCNRPINDQHL